MHYNTFLVSKSGVEVDGELPNPSDYLKPTRAASIVRALKNSLGKGRLRLWFVFFIVGFGLLMVARHFMQPHDPAAHLPSAVYYRRVKRGMTQEDVEKSCGRPEYAQQKNELGDEAESWFYTASDGSIEIYFDGGKVKLISRE